MSNISHQFATAIDLRSDYVLNQLFIKHGLLPDIDSDELLKEAWDLGLKHQFSEGIERLFEGTPLHAEYLDGHHYYETQVEEFESSCGSIAEWNALTDEERSSEWEEFHELCAAGIADTMYFYRVMMNMHLEDYVGH